MKENIHCFLSKIKKFIPKKEDITAFFSVFLQYVPTLLISEAFIFVIFSYNGFKKYQLLSMSVVLAISIILPVFRIKKLRIIKTVFSALFSLIAPFCIFYLVELYMHDPFGSSPMKEHIVILNVAFYYLLALLITAITTRTDVALIVTSLIPMALGIANNLSQQARSLPIYPWDVFSAQTAMSVVDNYTFKLTPDFVFSTFILLSIAVIAIPLNIRIKYKIKWLYVIPVTISILLFGNYISHINSIFKTESNASKEGFYPYLFSATYLYKYNGTPVSFIYTLKFLNLSPPSGYDVSDIKELYEKYKDEAEKDYEEKEDKIRPNVIVIMNEAFSDPSVLGDFTTNTSYMPFINSLVESGSAVKGNVFVSVKGGNTPNSEFEFLTGTSMAFLPSGSIPYQQYIDGPTLNLVTQLNDLGYYTVGMHNYYGSGWQRDEVYEYLGFDTIMFSGDFKTNREFIRGYLSDYSMYCEIMKLQETKGDEPMFVFGVTMQNHGDYPSSKNGSFIPTVSILNNKYSYQTYLNNYLSLIKESDKAFEKLVNYYTNECDEPTVILMFGDHQPNDHVVYPILAANGINMQTASLDVQQLRYQTPYIMWSNYGVDMNSMPNELSLNYLAAMLTDTAEMPLTPFQSYQLELYNEYPIVNAFCYVDKDGNCYSIADIKNVTSLQTLNKIQYNLVFDRKKTVQSFFNVVRK